MESCDAGLTIDDAVDEQEKLICLIIVIIANTSLCNWKVIKILHLKWAN